MNLRANKLSSRGYFGIGVYQAKHFQNVGVLWRGAYQLGAAFIFTVGKRYRVQATDIYATWRHVPLHAYVTHEEFVAALPFGCKLVGVETGGISLPGYAHPERAVYILGAEDSGLPNHVLDLCHEVVSIPAIRRHSYNVAQAGTIVMYDRMAKTKGAP